MALKGSIKEIHNLQMKRTLSKAILRKANMNSIKSEQQRIHDLGMKRTLRSQVFECQTYN